MDQKQIAKQMIKFYKTAFDNSVDGMSVVCEQNEKMVDTFLNQANWLPEEGKKAIGDWISAYRTGCADLKKLVDEGYTKAEAYFEKG